MKQMNLRELYLYLAEQWGIARSAQPSGYVYARIHDVPVRGLCIAAEILLNRLYISSETYLEFCDAISNHRFSIGVSSDYIWPTNQEGARARSAFCREQAAKLPELLENVIDC
jgi:hypothetical protein